MSVTLLAPAYNEEAVIADFVPAAIGALHPGWELLVVDDGSTDATGDLLEKLAAGHPELRVVTHERNGGLGAALATGFAAAAGDVVVTIDADLSHPFDLLPALVAACETADAAFASRFVAGGGMPGVPLLRRAISGLGNLAFRALFRTRVRDLTTGYRAYRAAALRALDLRSTGFEAQLEISVSLVHAGCTIAELPLQLSTRAAGESKMSYLRLLRGYGSVVLRMFALRWGLRRRG